MRKSCFRALIELRGINPFLRVSALRAATVKSDWRKPMPVLLRINGKPAEAHRTNMMPAGNGGFYLYLNGIVRSATGTSVGDRVSVEVEFDADYRGGPQHSIPKWFKDAMNENPDAKRNWEVLPPSRRKEVLRYFAQLKSEDAKMRNLSKALHVLSGKQGRFMARAWKNGA